MDMQKSGLQMQSGRVIYAYANIFGIGEDLEITGGYDENLSQYKPGDYSLDNTGVYTSEDGIEIANRMIDLWQKFKIKQEGLINAR